MSLLFLNLITGGFGGFTGLQFPAFPGFSKPASDIESASNKTDPSPNLKFSAKKLGIPKGAVSFFKENMKPLLTFFAVLLAIGLLLLIIWTWFYSRIKLVLIQCLRTKEFFIGDYWRQTREVGESFFRFNFIGLVVSVVPILAVIAMLVSGFLNHTFDFKEHGWMFILAGVGCLGFFLGWLIVIGTLNRFLPVYMAMTGKGAIQSFRTFFSLGWDRILTALGSSLLFYFLSFAAGIAMSIALVFIVALLAILFGLGSLLGVFLVKLLSVPMYAVILIAIILIFPCIMAVAILITVPLETFLNYMVIQMLEE